MHKEYIRFALNLRVKSYSQLHIIVENILCNFITLYTITFICLFAIKSK